MAKLTGDLGPASRNASGEDGKDELLRFIDEINAIRARSGQRRRFRPEWRDGKLCMEEWLEVNRPLPANTPSRRYAGRK
jgi:hypothetical protein